MKAGLTITEMAQEIERQAGAKEDFLVNPRALEMDATGGKPMLRGPTPRLDLFVPGQGRLRHK